MSHMDLTLLSGSRPDLLRRTLESFDRHFFAKIQLANVFANIDLHGGDEKQRRKCITLIREYFPHAEISTPESSSFGVAVKYLWSLPSTKNFLHMEDDWVATRDFENNSIELASGSLIKQWFLVKPRFDQSLLTSYRFRPIDGLPFFLPNMSKPAFTTSPSVIDSKFANSVSKLINPELNPEKQMFNGLNPDLEEFMRRFRSKSLVSWWQQPLIYDIGREWQESRGIQVEIINGIHGYRVLDLEDK
jgi:hypothetical protein